MNTPTDLIRLVESAGGRLVIEDGNLFLEPVASIKSLVEELRAVKPEIIALLLQREANAWRDGFTRWVTHACVVRPRDFTNANHLLISFNQWANEWAAKPGATCPREVFDALLTEAGFLIGEVCGIRLASGLMLRADVLSLERYQRADAMPAKPAAMPARKRGKGWAA